MDDVNQNTFRYSHAKDLGVVFSKIHDKNCDHRTMAIMVAAYLEDYLGELITSRMPGLNSQIKERIFGLGGSAAGLAQKIDLATALGIIPMDYRHDCILVARIRNRFAHQIAIDDFEHPEIAAMVDRLKVLPMLKKPNDGRHRDRFVVCASAILSLLNNAILDFRNQTWEGQDLSASR